MSYEDLRKASQELQSLRAAVEWELRKTPGVLGVGPGMRICSGTWTGEPCFRIYVNRKLPRSSLLAAELIPTRLFGYATDIHAPQPTRPECGGDSERTRPLLAGVRIQSVWNLDQNDYNSPGTLGCFLQLTAGSQVLGLTNYHVARDPHHLNAQALSIAIYQPEKGCSDCNQIGTSFAEPSDPQVVDSKNWIGPYTSTKDNLKYYLDCSLINLDKTTYTNNLKNYLADHSGETESVSIPSKPGVEIIRRKADGKIVSFSNSGSAVDLKKIVGSASPVLGELVWKVGATTGLTIGIVENLTPRPEITYAKGGTSYPATVDRELNIRPLAGYRVPIPEGYAKLANGDYVEAFSNTGDSGSVYMNLNNEVVGHHHHGGAGTDEFKAAINDKTLSENPFSTGTPIDAVLDKFGAKVVDDVPTIPSLAPSNELAHALWRDAPAEVNNLDLLWADLRDQFSSVASGRLILSLINRHYHEVIRLVWTERAVTAAWHRHHGPAFVALFARSLARPGTAFPTEAGGVRLGTLIQAMADILSAHGSPSLRDSISTLRPWLPDIVTTACNLDEIRARLEQIDV